MKRHYLFSLALLLLISFLLCSPLYCKIMKMLLWLPPDLVCGRKSDGSLAVWG